jgi:hypothetical protein
LWKSVKKQSEHDTPVFGLRQIFALIFTVVDAAEMEYKKLYNNG